MEQMELRIIDFGLQIEILNSLCSLNPQSTIMNSAYSSTSVKSDRHHFVKIKAEL